MDIQTFFTGLSEIFAAGRTDQVSGYLRQSLSEAEAQGDRHAAVTILNEMVGYFRSISSYQDAIRAAEYAIKEMKSLGYEKSISFGTTLLNAATAFRASGDSQKALELYSETLAIYRDQLPEDDPRLAGLYNNISSLHEEAGEYAKACELLQKALGILSRSEATRIDAATVHTNLALVLFKLHREPEAMSELRTALDIFEREGGAGRQTPSSKAPHYAAALAGLAQAYYMMRQYNMAAQVYESALSQIQGFFGENRDFAVTCRNYALALEALGQNEKAEEQRKKAGKILTRLGLA